MVKSVCRIKFCIHLRILDPHFVKRDQNHCTLYCTFVQSYFSLELLSPALYTCMEREKKPKIFGQKFNISPSLLTHKISFFNVLCRQLTLACCVSRLRDFRSISLVFLQYGEHVRHPLVGGQAGVLLRPSGARSKILQSRRLRAWGKVETNFSPSQKCEFRIQYMSLAKFRFHENLRQNRYLIPIFANSSIFSKIFGKKHIIFH